MDDESELFTELLKSNVNRCDSFGRTALRSAALQHDQKAVDAILKHGGDKRMLEDPSWRPDDFAGLPAFDKNNYEAAEKLKKKFSTIHDNIDFASALYSILLFGWEL
jgi:ankyrin repeat protein